MTRLAGTGAAATGYFAEARPPVRAFLFKSPHVSKGDSLNTECIAPTHLRLHEL
ncbi:MAG: hypothetical protein IPL32_03945 [Chloracidobacterium sp.]|nr:hypothetical protein [Chloracidobacterium sp.]